MSAGKIIRHGIRILHMDGILRFLTQHQNVHSFIGKLAPEFTDYPANTIRHVTRNGLRYELDISDYQEWLIYFGFTNDTPEGLFDLIQPHFNIMDVGANVGQTCMAFARHVRPSQQIWAFEPDAVNFKKCRENIRLNRFENIHLENAGLGSYAHDAFLDPKIAQNRGGCRVQENTANGIPIRILALDQYVKEHHCQVNLIKIDVEGYEYEVLKGATETLTSQRPILFVEIDDEHLRAQNTTPAAVITYLISMGYHTYHASARHLLKPEHDFSKCHFDLYALPA